MTDLTSLIERLETAEGPDREIDRLIHFHVESPWLAEKCVKWVPAAFEGPNDFLWWSAERQAAGKQGYHDEWESYTNSVDAALAFVHDNLPGWTIASIGQDDRKGWHAEMRKGHATSYSTVELAGAPTPALALVLATLRALQSKGGEA